MSAEDGNPRVVGALGKLKEIVARICAGELVIGDFFINASSSDPDRMNIEMKIVRGSGVQIVDDATPIQFAQAAREAEIARAREDMRAAERAERARQQGLMTGAPPPRTARNGPMEWAEYDANGNRLPFGAAPKPKPKPPERPKLTDGARDLDLDFD